MPMGFARRPGEGGRHRDQQRPGPGQRRIERGKADVIADAEAEAPEVGIGQPHGIAGRICRRFAIAAACPEVDIEQVQLVVGLDDRAIATDQIGAVGDPAVRATDGERADRDQHAPRRRHLAQRRQRRLIRLVEAMRQQPLRVAVEDAAHLRGEDDVGPLARQVGDCGRERRGIGRRGDSGAGLDDPGADHQAASSGSSFPAASSAASSSDPPI